MKIYLSILFKDGFFINEREIEQEDLEKGYTTSRIIYCANHHIKIKENKIKIYFIMLSYQNYTYEAIHHIAYIIGHSSDKCESILLNNNAVKFDERYVFKNKKDAISVLEEFESMWIVKKLTE